MKRAVWFEAYLIQQWKKNCIEPDEGKYHLNHVHDFQTASGLVKSSKNYNSSVETIMLERVATTMYVYLDGVMRTTLKYGEEQGER